MYGDGDTVMLAGGLLESVGKGLIVTVSPPTSRSFVGMLGEEGGGGGGPVSIVAVSPTEGTD